MIDAMRGTNHAGAAEENAKQAVAENTKQANGEGTADRKTGNDPYKEKAAKRTAEAFSPS